MKEKQQAQSAEEALPEGAPRLEPDELLAAFAFLEEWEDRFRYLIDLGRTLPPLPEEAKTESARVQGCTSQVWIVAQRVEAPDGPLLLFQGDSDAHIVKGLLAIVLGLASGRRPEDILRMDYRGIIAGLGFDRALTPSRANGLFAMVERLRRVSREALSGR